MKPIRSRFSLLTLSALLIFAIGSANCASDSDIPPSQQLKAFCGFVFGQGGNNATHWLGGSDGLLLKTTDDGQNFTQIDPGFSYGIHDLSFSPDGQYGYAIGPDGMYAQSNDFGNTWNTQMLGTGSGTGINLNGLTWAPNNDQFGWIVGDQGSIYFSNDQGINWDLQDSKTTANLYGVCFTDEFNGWAVGDNGTITGTSDGGQNWDLKTSGVSVSLRYCFRDDFFGLAVGFGGTVLDTNDFGNTWNKQQTNITNDLYALAVKPDKLGTVVAAGDGIIIRSGNFGFANSWENVFDEAQAQIDLFVKRLVYALSGGDVFAVGYTGLGQGFDFESIPDLVPPGETPSSDGLTLQSDDDGVNWFQVGIKVQF